MAKYLMVGGNPLGHEEAFAPETHSGKILRKIVQELNLNAEYFDLWTNQEEENKGVISEEKGLALVDFYQNSWQIIALGTFVFTAIRLSRWKYLCELDVHRIIYLPHPASRNPRDIAKLKYGLEDLEKLAEHGSESIVFQDILPAKMGST